MTPAQAGASSFKAFAPQSGVRKAEVNLGAECSITKQVKLTGSLAASRLTGDAGKSRMVERKSNVALAFGVGYEF